jgi:hypothetical protein
MECILFGMAIIAWIMGFKSLNYINNQLKPRLTAIEDKLSELSGDSSNDDK